MRKVKTERDKQIINRVLGIVERTEGANVQGYHQGGGWDMETYAFAGFKSNKYFGSDRAMPLNERFERADGRPLKGYGVEWEMECWSINSPKALAAVCTNILFPCLPDDLFKMQRDRSLRAGNSSVECITQVMTKEFIRNNYNGFKAMFTLMDMFEISATRSGNCGMHVNISNACFGATENAQEQAIRKLYYFINRNFSLACSLLRRDENRTGYCARMTQDAKTTPVDRFTTGHNICFNWAHYRAGRIELRLVGGQHNFPAFRNTMETIFFLVDACKRTPWDKMDDLKTLFSGCNNYVFSRLSLARDEGKISTEILNTIAPTVEQIELV